MQLTPQKTHSFTLAGALALLALVVGCKGYEVSVNNRQVYSPTPLYTGFSTADHNLQQCIDQHIADQKLTQPGQLLRLRCSHAGIQSLAGIEHFSALTELDLSDNRLADIAPVAKLGRLQRLNLANNRIANVDPLLALVHLQALDITGNTGVDCGALKQLAHNQGFSPRAPAHCGEE